MLATNAGVAAGVRCPGAAEHTVLSHPAGMTDALCSQIGVYPIPVHIRCTLHVGRALRLRQEAAPNEGGSHLTAGPAYVQLSGHSLQQWQQPYFQLKVQ